LTVKGRKVEGEEACRKTSREEICWRLKEADLGKEAFRVDECEPGTEYGVGGFVD
jgi:hypothetical protein